MDETELKAVLAAERAAALGGMAGAELAAERARAMDYYLGDMDADMPAAEGRSRAVSTDVADTVDGIMPSLMDIFTGSDEIVRFAPMGPEDEAAAQQETDYVNHIFFHENDGFVVLHGMIKDALIQKNGIVKFWWEEGRDGERETYTDLTDDAFAAIALEASRGLVEIVAYTAREVPPADQAGEARPTTKLHDVVVIRGRSHGRVRVMAVPPEEFLISARARSIADAPYCAHVVKRTVSELIAAGYPREVIERLPSGTASAGDEAAARATVGDDDSQGEAVANAAMRLIAVTEHYIRVDWDGDGIAELRKITTAGPGDEILDNVPYDRMPFAGITPILMSHRFWGRSLADLVVDVQRIKTALLRALLDNAYFANNQRLEVAETHASDYTLDDLLTNRPGGIVRTRMPGGLTPIPSNPIGPHVFPVLEYMDATREVRTGVQRFAVGPDANALNPYNATATGANILASAAQQRIRLIARTFAETGIKDLFLGIHALVLKHGVGARTVKLRNAWVTVDPRQWKTRKDMTVLVGLGTGTRDQIQAYLSQILAMQVRAIEMQGGPSGPLVTLANVYNTLRRLVENAGFRTADAFFTAPAEGDGASPPAPDPRHAAAAQKLELEREKAALDAQLAKYRADLDAEVALYKARLGAEVKQRIAALEAEVALTKPGVRPGGVVG